MMEIKSFKVNHDKAHKKINGLIAIFEKKNLNLKKVDAKL